MLKPSKTFAIWALILSATGSSALEVRAEENVSSAPRVAVHVGFLQESQLAVLDRVFLKPLSQDPIFTQTGVALEIVSKSEAPDVIRSLSDPSTIGVIWIGHPALELAEDRTILNSFLQSASGRYLPKSVLSAAHPGLKFMALVTCHTKDPASRYLPSLPANVATYLPPLSKVKNSDNPLYDLASLYTAPQAVLSKIKSDLPRFLEAFEPRPANPSDFLEISTRDLLSNRFDYEVLVDGKLIGVLEPVSSASGRKLNQVKIRIPFEPSRPDFEIVVRPDDATRARRPGLENVIDDILVDRIESAQGAVHLEPVHLGDDREAWDSAIGLSFLSNFDDFRKFAPQSELRIHRSP